MVRLDNFQQTVFVNFSKTVRQSSGSALLEGRLPHSQERACPDSIRAESICANLGRMKPEHWRKNPSGEPPRANHHASQRTTASRLFFSYSWFDTIDYGRQVELREITKERVKKLLNDWKKAGWMELISRYNKVFDILPTEDFFWEMGDRYPHEIFKAEVQRRGERYARVNRNAIHVVDVMFGIFTACADLKNGKSVEDQTAGIRKLMDEPDGP